jgi:hypothetical protein
MRVFQVWAWEDSNPRYRHHEWGVLPLNYRPGWVNQFNLILINYGRVVGPAHMTLGERQVNYGKEEYESNDGD